MKKLIQISLILVIVLIFLQATVGSAFALAEKTASFESPQYATATAAGQSVQLLSCTPNRLVSRVVPNVGWNS